MSAAMMTTQRLVITRNQNAFYCAFVWRATFTICRLIISHEIHVWLSINSILVVDSYLLIGLSAEIFNWIWTRNFSLSKRPPSSTMYSIELTITHWWMNRIQTIWRRMWKECLHRPKNMVAASFIRRLIAEFEHHVGRRSKAGCNDIKPPTDFLALFPMKIQSICICSSCGSPQMGSYCSHTKLIRSKAFS